MINAFLVFNGSGQPRLTKFYTQLASPPTTKSDIHHHGHANNLAGHNHAAAPNIRNLHPCI